jgi:alpha,alpha-trehalase
MPDGWSLVYEGFEPRQEGLREALCTLGNGYFATRGAGAEASDDGVHYPGTYVAGCYNRLKTEIAGRAIWNEDLVNVPNWLPLTFRIADGCWFDLSCVELLGYRQELMLATGELVRALRFRDEHGRETKVESRRLVHMAGPHLAAQETTITAVNWSGSLEIRSALDGRVVNNGVARYRQLNRCHLEALATDCLGEDTLSLKVRTSQSRIELAQAARTRVYRNGERESTSRETIIETGYAAHELAVSVAEGESITVEKVTALYTSKDRAISECGLEARKAVGRAGRFDDLLQTHARAWEHLWRRFDITIELEGDEGRQQHELLILRLHVFHLLQTASLNTRDLDVGVPPRGLHGEAYRGHIFWDEVFIFPLLNLRMPEITRGLLLYRYRRLGEARIAASEAGFQGAMYPWQSGSNGREETQQLHLNPKSGRWLPDRSHRQRHVNAAIAYNVWQYYQVTGDLEFLSFFGAEMLLEIARFWASIASYNADLNRYEIRGVMGPDEYHDGYPDTEEPGLCNNAYTNLMAVWVLCRALDVLKLLPEDRSQELQETLGLSPEEIARWEEISRRMRLVFFRDGILSQFEGYEHLKELDWEAYRKKYGDIHRLDRILEAEGDSANRYKVSKQADLNMILYLFSTDELSELLERLGYQYDPEAVPRNIEYYMHRTSHGSTLSRVVDSWVLARSDRPGSWELFTEALESDVADIQGGTTPEGIHLGAMAGTVDIIQRCYTGIEMRGDVLWLNPRIPEQLRRLRLRILYRGQAMQLDMTKDRLKITSLPSAAESIKLRFRDETFELGPKETREFPL